MEILEKISSIDANWVSAIATIAIAYTAYRGLNSWKDQHKSKNEYELAKRILMGVFDLRDAVDKMREAFLDINNTKAYQDNSLTNEEKDHATQKEIYNIRWKKVKKSIRSIDSELLEAKVLWGGSLEKKIKKMEKLIMDNLLRAIEYNLAIQNPDVDSCDKDFKDEELKKIEKQYRGILVSREIDNDPFKAELEEHIEKIRKFLKPKMRL